MNKVFILIIISSFSFNAHTAFAQKMNRQKKDGQTGFYKKEMKTFHEIIQKHFFDSTSGYYKEVPHPARDHNPYSYLWPLCAMLQAGNEMELLDRKQKMVDPILMIIQD